MARREQIETPSGAIAFLLPSDDRVAPLRERWPLPLGVFTDPEDAENARAEFSLPFEGDERVLGCCSMQQLPLPTKRALAVVARDREVLAAAVGALARAGHEGLILPCATLREEEGGVAVPGLAFFCVPGDAERAAAEAAGPSPFDERLGLGADVFARAASQAIGAAQAQVGDLAPVSAFGTTSADHTGRRWLDFAVAGEVVYALQEQVDPGDPVWEALRGAGVEEVVHLPVGGSAPVPLDALLRAARAHSATGGALQPDAARRVLALLAHVAACDGAVEPRERSVLERYAEQLGLGAAAVDPLLAEPPEELAIAPDPAERAVALDGAFDVAAADGVLARAEEDLLRALAGPLGVTPAALEQAITERFVDRRPPTGRLESRQAGEAALSANGARRIYRLLYNLAAADGVVDPVEEAYIEGFRRRHGIADDEAAAIAEAAREGRDLRVGKRPAERALLIESMVELAAIDGVLTPQEEKKLHKVAAAIGLPGEEIDRRLTDLLALDDEGDDAAPGDQAARVVLLDLPKDVLTVDLAKVRLRGGFRGLTGVPPGVHRLAVRARRGEEAAAWLCLEPGEVRVLAFDEERLAAAEAERTQRYAELAESGALEPSLQPFPHHTPWARLTRPLAAVRFPPRLHRDPERGGEAASRLERALEETHGGDAASFLAELAFAFLRGVLDEDRAAFARWQQLVQAIYHCGERLPAERPALFVDVVDLLIAQQTQLPREVFREGGPVVEFSRYLSEDLRDTGLPALVAAADRWALFRAGHHPGAEPAPVAAPAAEPSRSERVRAAEADLEAAEAEGRAADERLRLLTRLVGVHEAADDPAAALAAQRRLVSAGEEAGLDPVDRAKTLQALARLCRANGLGPEADELEARVIRLLEDSAEG